MGEKTTVKVDKKLVKKAHEVGLNASKICENALEKAIEAIEGTSGESSSRGNRDNPSKSRTKIMVRGKGFEPSNPYGTGSSSLRLRPGSATPARF